MTLIKTLCVSSVLFILAAMTIGCGDAASQALLDMKEINSTNVAKVRTCFVIFESRKGKSPKNKDELLEFLKSGQVDKNLKRIDITQDNLDDIFVSERDGEPLKIRWGLKMNPEKLMPIAFETKGVDGIRLVAADVVLQVDNDAEYDRLWDGEYESEMEKLRKSGDNEELQ